MLFVLIWDHILCLEIFCLSPQKRHQTALILTGYKRSTSITLTQSIPNHRRGNMPRRGKNVGQKKKRDPSTKTKNGTGVVSIKAPKELLQVISNQISRLEVEQKPERNISQKMTTSQTSEHQVPFTVPHPNGGFYTVHYPFPASSFFTQDEGFVDDDDSSLDQDEELNRLVCDIIEEDKSSKYLPPPTRVYRLWGWKTCTQ